VTFSSIDCRLDALTAKVNAAPDIGDLRSLLLHQLERAKTRKEQARALLGEGEATRGRAALRHAIRWMIAFVHRTGTLRSREHIGAATRQMLSQEGRSILRDMQTLLRTTTGRTKTKAHRSRKA
jgi:CHASE3 domain sensor protein